MKIVAKQKTFARAVSTANSFTDKKPGANSSNQDCVLIVADQDMGSLTFTATSEHVGVEFIVSTDVDVLESGRVMIPSTHLDTALSTIRDPDTMIECELIQPDRIHLRGGTADIQLSTKEISNDQHAIVPSVQDAGDSTLTVKASEFVKAYNVGSEACNPGNQHMIMRGVHLSSVNGKLRVVSASGSSMTYAVAPVISNDDDNFACILDSSFTRNVLGYIDQGDQVDISLDTDSGIHYQIRSGDDILYHIRTATFDRPAADFPVSKMCVRIAEYLKSSEYSIAVDKSELLRLMVSADKMMSLYPSENKGQNKTVRVSILGEELSTEIFGGAEYRDRTEVEWNGGDFRCIIKWGLFGNLIASYPEDTIHFKMWEKDGAPTLLIMHTSDWDEIKLKEDAPDLPENYISTLPISSGEHTSI